MEPLIQTLSSKTLIGQRMRMNHVADRTPELFRGFMPRRKEIIHATGSDVFCIKVYDALYSFQQFDPGATFEKWAAVEVAGVEKMPDDMERFDLPGGLYAMFIHRGSSRDASTFEYIFGSWLPNQKLYDLDHRPHFEIMGEKYKNNDPGSEEEIWIPIKAKPQVVKK